MDQASQVQGTGAAWGKDEPKIISVLLVLVLTVITFGIYYPVWFLKRREALNNFESKTELNKGTYIGLIALVVVSLLLDLVSGYATIQAQGGNDLSRKIEVIRMVLSLVYTITLIIGCFKVRSILDDHFNARLNLNIPFSKLPTLIFGILYLQYKINRLPDARRRMAGLPRTAEG